MRLNLKKTLISAGIVSLVIFLVVIFGFFQKPDKTIIAQLDYTSPINRTLFDWNMSVYYRGFKVGKVSQVKLSDNQKYVQLYIDIYYKDLKLPKNTSIEIGIENIFGQKYVALSYPKKPSPYLLSNNSILTVKQPQVLAELNEFLQEEFSKRRARKLLKNLENLSGDLDLILKRNKDILSPMIKQTSLLEKELRYTLMDIRKITSQPELSTDIGSTMHHTASTMKNINEITNSPQNKAAVKQLINKTDNALDELSAVEKNVDSISKILPETKIAVDKVNVKVENIDNKIPQTMSSTMKKVDCLSDNINNTLKTKFLLYKMLLGNPILSTKKCKKAALKK